MDHCTEETCWTKRPFLVLYVEDDESMRILIPEMLSRRHPGIIIKTAENGAVGLEIFKEFHPDMVITDNNMPIMSGVKMVSNIRLLCPKTVILFLTADINLASMQCLHALGGIHYMQKPIVLDEFYTLIDGCLAEYCSGRVHLADADAPFKRTFTPSSRGSGGAAQQGQ